MTLITSSSPFLITQNLDLEMREEIDPKIQQEIESWAKSTRLTTPAKKEELYSRQPWELSARRVAHLLEKVIAANSNVVQQCDSPFDAIFPPTISIYNYLLRFKNMEADGSEIIELNDKKRTESDGRICILACMTLIDLENHNEITITTLNVHRLILISLGITQKILEDHPCHNRGMAHRGGVSFEEYNICEMDFFLLTEGDFWIQPKAFNTFTQELIEFTQDMVIPKIPFRLKPKESKCADLIPDTRISTKPSTSQSPEPPSSKDPKPSAPPLKIAHSWQISAERVGNILMNWMYVRGNYAPQPLKFIEYSSLFESTHYPNISITDYLLRFECFEFGKETFQLAFIYLIRLEGQGKIIITNSNVHRLASLSLWYAMKKFHTERDNLLLFYHQTGMTVQEFKILKKTFEFLSQESPWIDQERFNVHEQELEELSKMIIANNPLLYFLAHQKHEESKNLSSIPKQPQNLANERD